METHIYLIESYEVTSSDTGCVISFELPDALLDSAWKSKRAIAFRSGMDLYADFDDGNGLAFPEACSYLSETPANQCHLLCWHGQFEGRRKSFQLEVV